ncbi:hypothetical protein [Acinetobacter brisouii]|uniref:hypothetical protein n=1 Tax=Acinetobacter brisouii TaxID=396323 RepID=UPI00124E27AF|nr:hypothetical protein [Acinetobacter brisouii]
MSPPSKQTYLWNEQRLSLYAIAKREGISYPSIQNRVWKDGMNVADAVRELKRAQRLRMYFDVGDGMTRVTAMDVSRCINVSYRRVHRKLIYLGAPLNDQTLTELCGRSFTLEELRARLGQIYPVALTPKI